MGKYDEIFVNDVAKVLKVCSMKPAQHGKLILILNVCFQLAKLFLPLPIYFALLAQQDSSWTFQASLMNTTIAGNFTIQPDQAKAMGPIFLFILIPMWQYLMKPFLKCCFNYELKPLQSVTLGGVFSAFSFISAGVLHRYILVSATKKPM